MCVTGHSRYYRLMIITTDGACITVDISEVYPLVYIDHERPLQLIPEPLKTSANMMPFSSDSRHTLYEQLVDKRDREVQQCKQSMDEFLESPPKGKWYGSTSDATHSYDDTWTIVHRVMRHQVDNGNIAAIIPQQGNTPSSAFMTGAVLHMSNVADHYGYAPSINNLFMLFTD